MGFQTSVRGYHVSPVTTVVLITAYWLNKPISNKQLAEDTIQLVGCIKKVQKLRAIFAIFSGSEATLLLGKEH